MGTTNDVVLGEVFDGFGTALQSALEVLLDWGTWLPKMDIAKQSRNEDTCYTLTANGWQWK